jgi:predicted GTPase
VIVLDEQLLGRGLEQAISKWYRGRIVFITKLRPNTVIKDDAIPHLLRSQQQPTFVTINSQDFWQKVNGDKAFCIACFAFSDAHGTVIPELLRRLFRHQQFRTKKLRMGQVVRVTLNSVTYYTAQDKNIRTLDLE